MLWAWHTNQASLSNASHCRPLELAAVGKAMPTSKVLKVTGYLELYDLIYVYIYATKTGILKS